MIDPIQRANVSQIFVPQGEITLNADYATLRITQNVSKLYEETRKLCETSKVIDNFISQRVPKGLSAPNKRVLLVLKQNIKNTCEEDTSTWTQIKNSFGLNHMDEKEDIEPRQIVIATAIITSLVTYFTTSQLISMSSDDDEDDLFESTNHLIAAIKNHETRLVRLEAQQDQLRKHLEKLTNALVMGIRTQDIHTKYTPNSRYFVQIKAFQAHSYPNQLGKIPSCD